MKEVGITNCHHTGVGVRPHPRGVSPSARLFPPSHEPTNSSRLGFGQPQRQPLKNRHPIRAADSVGNALAHPADDLLVCRAHRWRALRYGMAVRTQAMYDAALEPTLQRLRVHSVSRLGDAAGRYLDQAAGLDQLFNLPALMQKLLLTLQMRQDRPDAHLVEALNRFGQINE